MGFPKMPLLSVIICVVLSLRLLINRRALSCVSSLSPSFLPPLSRFATMLSALPAFDPFQGNPFSALDYGFTSWDGPDFLGFKPTSPNPVTSSSGSDDPNLTRAEEKPDWDESNRVASVMEERKRRRMISNRESARRSRMRKQRHVENLLNQVNLFRVENRELNNGLQFLLHHCNRLRTENEWLRSEQTLLRQKLAKINQILVFQQFQRPFSSAWPCNIVTLE